jgi:hypothetical protein
MRKQLKWVAVALFAAVFCTGLAALLATPPVSAAGQCWQVDCNICCRTGGGKIICTQRACV